MGRYIKLLIVAVSISLIFTMPSAFAQNTQNENTAQLKQKITALEKRVKELEGLLKVYRGPMKLGPDDQQGWWNRKSWRQLKEGMTQKQVKAILGEPVKIIKGIRILWYYPNLYRGYVSFDDNGKLTTWIEP